MVKIQHVKTGETLSVTRKNWEKLPRFVNMRNSWTVLDPGDPVMLIYNRYNQHSEAGLVDRDEAEGLMKFKPHKWYYRELDEVGDSRVEVMTTTLPRSHTNSTTVTAPTKSQSRRKPVFEKEDVPIWSKIKIIGGILGAIGSILAFLQQCAG